MIERQTIDGREAIVAYLKMGDNDMWQPADRDDAEMIKIIFDDGEHMWLNASTEVEDEDNDEAGEPL
jgi:hypothetical protein